MSAVWRIYIRLLEKHPWKTQAIQTGVLMCTGDAVAQVLVEKKNLRNFDLRRMGTFGVMGLLFVGPALRGWYLTMDKIVGTSGKTVAVKKVILDQGLFAPFLLVNFFGILGVLQGRSFNDIRLKIEKDYVDVVITGWKIWPAAQLVNFYFTPPQHRILFVNSVALFWNIYLAYKTGEVNPHELPIPIKNI